MQRNNLPLQLLVFAFLLGLLIALVQLGALTIAFEKLGLSAASAFMLLFASLFGSAVNLPLFTLHTGFRIEDLPELQLQRLRRFRIPVYSGRTTIAVNLGGCLIPVTFSVYLLVHAALEPWRVLLAVTTVSAISYAASRPVAGIGIAMPILVAPVAAAISAVVLAPTHSAPLAYIAGTLGVLIGADLFRLRDIRKIAAPMASIGGAGTFDGIFMTGILAVLLA